MRFIGYFGGGSGAHDGRHDCCYDLCGGGGGSGYIGACIAGTSVSSVGETALSSDTTYPSQYTVATTIGLSQGVSLRTGVGSGGFGAVGGASADGSDGLVAISYYASTVSAANQKQASKRAHKRLRKPTGGAVNVRVNIN